MTARDAAVQVLAAVRREQSYSNVVLENALSKATLSPADTALATRLVYGVLEWQITLDHCLAACADKPLKKMHPAVTDALRVAAYQLLFMERIPVSAAVNEAVTMVKKRQPYAAGLVNGVLRSLDRRREELLQSMENAGDEVKYSCPAALIDFWRAAYGDELTGGLLRCLNEAPPQYLRVNTLVTTTEELVKALKTAGIGCRVCEEVPDCVEVFAGGDLKRLESVKQNGYYHQDLASQICCRALGALPGERIADVCAAPGGKSFTVAQYMQNRGEILAGDIYPPKCDLMSERAARLGVSIVNTVCRDASAPVPAALRGRFDRVICDAPCSGLGVIRRKPEIRYKNPADFADLPQLQLRILTQAAAMVRPGGVLQYSTCTLNPAENRAVAERFLKEVPGFVPRALPGVPAGLPDEPDWCRTLFPPIHHTDGFFIAGFTRQGAE